MITRSTAHVQPLEWTQELRQAYSEPSALLDDLGLDPARMDLGDGAGFAFRVPRPYARRMRAGDPADPLLRQVLPLAAESREVPGFGPDPVGDLASQRAPNVLQKYHGRALVIATGACAINCRYCFRRHYPYTTAPNVTETLIDEVRTEPSIEEVILSGGDPLLLSDPALLSMIEGIAAIDHVRRVRIHTRLPVTIPSRFSPGLIGALTATRLAAVVVLHINHPNEIDDELRAALQNVAREGITLLNQSVLLRGVNDSADVLTDLSRELFEAQVLPYYVHLLDPVAGAAHFDVPADTAKQLAASLRDRLPGYLVPRFAREQPGAASKTLIA